MPTYQYSCTECGHFFEIQQSFTDDSLTVCPDCDGRLRKVFNAVGVVFKGSGFYRNDSRGEQKSSVAANGSNGSSNGSSDTGSGSDSSGSSTSTTSSPKESASTSGGSSSSNGSGSTSGSGSSGSSGKGKGSGSSSS